MRGKDGCTVGAGIPWTAMIAASVFLSFSCSILDICSKMYAYIPKLILSMLSLCTTRCQQRLRMQHGSHMHRLRTNSNSRHVWFLRFLDANLCTSQHYLRNPHLNGFKTQMDCFKVWMNFANPTRWLLFLIFFLELSHYYIPCRELTYPTWGKGKTSSQVIFVGIC